MFYIFCVHVFFFAGYISRINLLEGGIESLSRYSSDDSSDDDEFFDARGVFPVVLFLLLTCSSCNALPNVMQAQSSIEVVLQRFRSNSYLIWSRSEICLRTKQLIRQLTGKYQTN